MTVDPNELLEQIANRIEQGKAQRESLYPPELKGQEGASELTRRALAANCPPEVILNHGLIVGMTRIGDRFSAGEVYIPELLFAARAMNAAMDLIRPFFQTGELEPRGTAILGTAAGDLHDIGKNIVRMVFEGGGWQVVDLGVDVGTEKFLRTLDENPGSIVGMSALLTTTMLNMARSVEEIKRREAGIRVFVGGAPVTQEFSARIGADGYFPEPNGLVRHLAARS
jgi:5-methyltetrahydrofolate--homocysteine methyltransferase